MDNQKLEERLEKLKASYDQMPTFSDSERMMKAIKAERKQTLKRMGRFRKLPIIASIAGIVIAGGIIGQGLIMPTAPSESSSDQPVKNNEDLSEVLTKDFTRLTETLFLDDLGLPNIPDNIAFIEEARAYMLERKEHLEQMNGEKAEAFYKLSLSELEKKLEAPAKTIARLQVEQDIPVNIRSDEVVRLILKLKQLQPILEAALNEQTFTNEQLQTQGYELTKDGVTINWRFLEDQYVLITNDSVSQYLQIQAFIAQQASPSWNDLARQVVRLEHFLQSFPQVNTDFITDVHALYRDRLMAYLGKSDVRTAFLPNGYLRGEVQASYEQFLTNYPNTQTFFTIQTYYELLRQHSFQQSADTEAFTVGGLAMNIAVERDAQPVTGPLLPLSEAQQQMYDRLLASGETQSDATPLDILQLFARAVEDDQFEVASMLVARNKGTMPIEADVLRDTMDFISPFWLSLQEGRIKTLPGALGSILVWTPENEWAYESHFVRFYNQSEGWVIDWDGLRAQNERIGEQTSE
ncbi:hypothetical protein [Aureibacillus halotolerans]|uniref:Uncharacterized protein n=1 Tax=Aureibacillus halotolerans TaxID=1508390 RepID=A0A4R6U322_9BACI|nr:hypothetical protein [Aureibacillus halotolerans]TDQ40401.1 hypothetical protein EV213_106119 [Aureibacillus halotolerans]